MTMADEVDSYDCKLSCSDSHTGNKDMLAVPKTAMKGEVIEEGFSSSSFFELDTAETSAGAHENSVDSASIEPTSTGEEESIASKSASLTPTNETTASTSYGSATSANSSSTTRKDDNSTGPTTDTNRNNATRENVSDQRTNVLNTARMDHIYKKASVCCFAGWLFMLFIVTLVTDKSDWQYLPNEERSAAKLAMLIHFIALIFQATRMVTNRVLSPPPSSSFQQTSLSTDKAQSFPKKGEKKSAKAESLLQSSKVGNGILIAGATVQFISIATNTLLAFRPTVVKMDIITKSRVFLIRWCEWIPLSGFMTFLSESIEVNLSDDEETSRRNNTKKSGDDNNQSNYDPIGLKAVVLWSLSQTLSCIPGILFPYCHDLFTWSIVMIFSFLTYFCIFPRVFLRQRLYLQSLEQCRCHKAPSTVWADTSSSDDEGTNSTWNVEGNMESKGSTSNREDQQHKCRKSPSRALTIDFATSNEMIFAQQERLQIRKFSFYLIFTCSCVWTFLIVLYFLNMLVHCYPPAMELATVILRIEASAMAMVCDTFFDVFAKIVYFRLIIDVYWNFFEPTGKIHRQLHELRSLVSVIWESSSDVIAISVQVPKDVHPVDENRRIVISMLSPSFATLMGTPEGAMQAGDESTKSFALMLEMNVPSDTDPMESSSYDCKVFERYRVLSAYYVDAASFSIPSLQNSREKTVLMPVERNNRAVLEASRIVARAWNGCDISDPNPSRPNRPNGIILTPSNKVVKNWSVEEHPVVDEFGKELACEMKVSRHAENAIVAVLRDVTERDRRFEAERKAHAETMARQRDAQAANRFTRHEVKNGLLAGIELCDSMRTSFVQLKKSLITELYQAASDAIVDLSGNGEIQVRGSPDGRDERRLIIDEAVLSQRLDSLLQEGISKHIHQLDQTLQDVLETTLTEAMSREVVHEVYVPRMEQVNIPVLFKRFGNKEVNDRFPVDIVDQESMPELLLDIQLLNYIHRNAISNACKYGKIGGVVRTKVWYDAKEAILSLEVINEPGVGHKELMDMGGTANEAVFQQGVRLRAHTRGNRGAVDARASSGDGAWIMQKCAMTLGGTCSIQFMPSVTVFSSICPAVPAPHEMPNFHDFRVSPNTWGIAVDDSGIQRKLMDRILANVGVEDSKRMLLGGKPSDTEELNVTMKKLLSSDLECRILILMDENLDYVGEDSVPVLISGSFALKEMLSQLRPEHEARVLALVRSANDSAEEIVCYSLRSHGFFPKATMQRDRVREILAPLWEQRFGK